MTNNNNSKQTEYQFVTKVPTSYRISIPAEIKELLELRPGDYIRITIKVVKRSDKV